MPSDLSKIPVLVPEDVEDVGDLPMGLLDAASNHLGCDVIKAVRGEVPGKRYAAMVEICYQWARFTGQKKPNRETYRDYRIDQIGHALGWDRKESKPDPTPPNDDASESP